jgi:hypothetical protein
MKAGWTAHQPHVWWMAFNQGEGPARLLEGRFQHLLDLPVLYSLH